MRWFYAFWFFFCSGWGYLLATFAESDGPSLGQLFASFPVALLTFVVLFGVSLYRLPLGRRVQRPSLDLKPWNQPTGFLLFLALTFVFSSFWGVGIAVAGQLSGLRVALHFLALGAGALAAIFVSRYVFPSKFDT